MTPDHREEFTNFTSRFDPYSDFNFTSALTWDTDGSARISTLNDNLVITMPDYLTGTPVTSLLGESAIDESLDILATADIRELRLVPEVTVRSIQNPSRLQITEDADNFDYVYDLAELAPLGGAKYKRKRNKINNVHAAFDGRLRVATTSTIEDNHLEAIDHVFSGWVDCSGQSAKDKEPEQAAFQKLLQHAGSLSLLLTTATLDEKPVAFSVNEPLGNGHAICHYEKTLPVHGEIQSFIAHQAAKALWEAGCRYVNWEQDLGVEGLRKSKISFHPSHFLKKYTVKPKHG